MSEPNHKEHAHRRAQQLYARTKLTVQEVAELAGMSVNTVKRVLVKTGKGSEAHLNSILKIERELDLYIKAANSGKLEEHKLVLSGDTSKDVVIVAKKLATLMQELVFDTDKAKTTDFTALERILKSCNGHLGALSS